MDSTDIVEMYFFSVRHSRRRFRSLAANEQGLGAGGASTAARTGAKLANSHKLSGEPLPRLRQTQVMCRIFQSHFYFSNTKTDS